MDQTISPIAIDLGGKYTGVYMPHYVHGVLPSKDDASMTTLVLSEDGDKMTFSQTERTATRHRVRSNKRRKLAKRLLRVAMSELLGRETNSAEWNALSGLLNRRGYNRLEIDLDLSSLDNAASDLFAQILPRYFTEQVSISEQWDELQENIPELRELAQEGMFTLNKNEAKKQIFSKLDKDFQVDNILAYQTLQQAVEQILDSLDYGHQHRKKYLEKTQEEINRDSRLAAIREAVTPEKLYCLIGNISNFQLRNLRWYFNDQTMKGGDVYDDQRLKDSCVRWLQGWHPQTDEEKHGRKHALAHMQSLTDALTALVSLEPVFTIPPYEDQNNRRPPKDQTLWLNPVTLSARYGEKWLIWAQKLKRAQSEWAEHIEANMQFYERKSRLQRKNLFAEDSAYAAAIFLQRILDRSRALDIYALRLLSNSKRTSTKSDAYLEQLTKDLGSQHLSDFLQFSHDYYAEVNNAKQGIWFQTAHSLLEKADINPPSKAKIKHRIIGNILHCSLSEKDLTRFIKQVWEAKIHGNSTVRSVCKSVEDLRKHYGNSFNYELDRLNYLIQRDTDYEKKLKGEEKEIWTAHTRALLAASFIAKQLEHVSEQAKRYSNSFSMAQLYTILETDRHGFSKISLAAHLETSWRMQSVTLSDGTQSARCSRLAADSVRPFDGILRRLLERQAFEIAKIKTEQIEALGVRTGKILIPIIAEENRFEFSIGLAGIKKNRNKVKLLEKQLESQDARWQSKTERIQNSANSICPYTGEQVGRYGEIDHIIPRAESQHKSNTIFNSEANLIWASRKGNQKKREQRYFLNDLSPKYLQQVFGSSDKFHVQKTIEKQLEQLPERFIFVELSAEQQQAVRHALFLTADSFAYNKVFRSLATQQATRVNGTQAWLVKRIIELLESNFSQADFQFEFTAARVNAEQTSRVRQQLAEFDSEYAKHDRQSVASHSLDALCAFAIAAAGPLNTALSIGELLSENMSELAKLIPDQVAIRRIERKARYEKSDVASQSIFKEGIYAESFIPIWVSEGKLFVGFDGYSKEQKIAVQSMQPELLLKLLEPVLSNKIQSIEELLSCTKPHKLIIDKHQAFLLLDKVAKQPCSEQELILADFIDSLRYTTSNKDCQNTIYDVSKKACKSETELLNKKKFTLKLNFTNRKFGKFKGELLLPAYYDWVELLCVPEIKASLGVKNPVVNWHTALQKHFNSGSNRAHKKTRRVYSLPMVDSPSGGFRVHRKTAEGDSVWQLMAIDGLGSSGFYVADGYVLWKQATSVEKLKTAGLTEVNARHFSGADSQVVFNNWLPVKIDHPDINKVTMAPGTKDRRYISITQPFASFSQWLKAAGHEGYSSSWQIPSELKVDSKKFGAAHSETNLGSPRSNLFMLNLGDEVSYWYIVESSSSAMNNTYQAAYTASLE